MRSLEMELNDEIVKMCQVMGISKDDLKNGHIEGTRRLTHLVTNHPRFQEALKEESSQSGHSEPQLAMAVVQEMLQRFDDNV